MNHEAGLYLDTARFGRMTRSAQLAVRDFARLSGEGALTLYGEKFLRHGFNELPSRLQRICPHLASWQGVKGLESRLLALTNATDDYECLLVSRSSTLMRAAAKRLAAAGGLILCSDVDWPAYKSILTDAVRQRGTLIDVPLRALIAAGADSTVIVEAILHQAMHRECRAVYLTAVSHDGIRIPVDRICRLLRLHNPNCLIVVDASQAVGHVPVDLNASQADMVLTGSHKWLRAGTPLGIGVARLGLGLCDDVLSKDPLLTLGRRRSRAIETVNTWPLIACDAAIQRFSDPGSIRAAFDRRLRNAAKLNARLANTAWKSNPLDDSLATGVRLWQHRHAEALQASPGFWRRRFFERDVHLTAYFHSIIRLSVPARDFALHELDLLEAAC